ncbi:MAG TPA: hypothetical protein VGB64_12875 [Actinomycetota bacterium]
MKRGPLFWSGVAIGWAFIAAGAVGMIAQARFAKPSETALWIAGAVLAHDALVAPIVIVIAHALRRIVAPRWLAAAQAGLIGSAIVTIATLPIVLRLGRRADNPSLLPRAYGTGLAVTLAVVWLVMVTAALRAARRHPLGSDSESG